MMTYVKGEFKIERLGLADVAIDLLARNYSDLRVSRELTKLTKKRGLGGISNMAVKRWKEAMKGRIDELVESRRVQLLLRDYKRLKEASFKARQGEMDKMEWVITEFKKIARTGTDFEKLARVVKMKYDMLKDMDDFLGTKEQTPEIREEKKTAAQGLEEMRVLVSKSKKAGAEAVLDEKGELVAVVEEKKKD